METLRLPAVALAAVLVALCVGCEKEASAPAPVRGAEVKAPDAAPPEDETEDDKPAARSGRGSRPGLLGVPAGYVRVNLDGLNKAKKVAGLTQLQQSIQVFKIEKERYPESLEELKEYRGGAELPVLPKFYEYVYDPETGTIDVVDTRDLEE
jgi:hypothetical protein